MAYGASQLALYVQRCQSPTGSMCTLYDQANIGKSQSLKTREKSLLGSILKK